MYSNYLEDIMKARVVRRRNEGAVLAAPVPVVEGATMLEIVVVEITAPGNRRPIKVARLMPLGEQRILAQLLLPKLVKFVDWTMVLSGIEEVRDQYKQMRGVAQTWVCQLHVPANVVGFSIVNTNKQGVVLPRGALRDSYSSRGKLAVSAEFANSLQRYTTCAEIHGYQISTFPTARLVDCYIEWMSDERFELGGLRVWEANADHAQRLERDGWLCELDVEQPQLSKAQYRMLR
jgi:hypothetical protein